MKTVAMPAMPQIPQWLPSLSNGSDTAPAAHAVPPRAVLASDPNTLGAAVIALGPWRRHRPEAVAMTFHVLFRFTSLPRMGLC